MIYAAFTVWLFGIVFLGVGVFRVWTSVAKPLWVNWALLPGTLVSEMAYILGCLITGGEIRKARLLESPGSSGGGDSGPATEANQRLKVAGPIVASLLAVLACMGAILLVRRLLGAPVMDTFLGGGLLGPAELPKALPAGWDALWAQLEGHLALLRRMCETLGRLEWLAWRVPLFVYLSICFSVRLAPVGRDLRATLAALVAVAGVVAAVGALSDRFTNLLADDLWPLVTYIWALLLTLLALSLLARGVVSLVQILAGKAGRGNQ